MGYRSNPKKMSEKIINAKPAPYPNNNAEELAAVSCFLSIVDNKFVKPDVNFLDKVPNTDGFVELTDNDDSPVAIIRVQLKTASKVDPKKDYVSHQCDLPFLASCEGSIIPVLLIAVDVKAKQAYWEYISKECLIRLSKKIKKDSVALHIPKTNIISETHKDYIALWKEIHDKQKSKISDFDQVSENLRAANGIISKLSEYALPELGTEEEIYKDIHDFLDKYNYLLDHEFRTIKNLLYPDFWKIGLAYEDYTDTELHYIFYPIKYTINDVQIKRVTEQNRKKIENDGIEFRAHYGQNPIKYYPEKYAYELIGECVKSALTNKTITYTNNFLANEYIVQFIDDHYVILGLEKNRDSYSVSEVEQALTKFLPMFIEEMEGFENMYDNRLIDINSFRMHNYPEELEKGAANVRTKIGVGIVPNFKIRIKSRDYNLSYLKNCLQYKRQNKTDHIERCYGIKVRPNKTACYFWEYFPPEEYKKTVSSFFNNFHRIYTEFINAAFPHLINELNYFKGADKIAIHAFRSGDGSPSFEVYYLKKLTQGKMAPELNVFFEGDTINPFADRAPGSYFKDGVTIDQIEYKVTSMTGTGFDYLWEGIPMQKYLYKVLNDRFTAYFMEKKR